LKITFSKVVDQSEFSIPEDNADTFFVGQVAGINKGRKLKDNTPGAPGLGFMTTSNRLSSSAGSESLDML
jgi:hypothetical protein